MVKVKFSADAEWIQECQAMPAVGDSVYAWADEFPHDHPEAVAMAAEYTVTSVAWWPDCDGVPLVLLKAEPE